MLAASRSRRRTRATAAAALLGLGLVLAGCSTPGKVKDYNADTEENFKLSCAEANTGLSDDRRDELCGCWYGVISGDEGLSFEAFEKVEDDIRLALDEDRLNNPKDLEDIAPTFYKLVTENCVTEGPQAG